MPQTTPSPITAPTAPAPKLLHIFKPGTWTAMSGERIAFSAQDLAECASAFDPALSRAPLVIGHPATDDPAQGWTQALSANERGLFASPHQVDPAFAEAVNTGRFGAVSAMFYRPTDASNPKPGVWYLRHIGFLGGAAPAVKGLDLPAFVDGGGTAPAQGVCFTQGVALPAFGAYDDVTNAGLWRRMRDFFIADKGLAVADEVIPAWQVQSLEQAAQDEVREAQDAQTADPLAPQFSEPQPKESPVTLEEKTALEAENTRLKEVLQAQKRGADHAANAAFCDGLPGMLPTWRDVAVATLDHFDQVAEVAPVQFGEGDAAQPLAEQFKTLLQSLPAPVAFSETATAARAATPAAPAAFAAPSGFAVDTTALTQHNLAVAHQTQHGGTYVQAVAVVQARR